ncbi:hypothetical protein DH86_00001098 [Scytalidium sp. 3C]|nr:hypothetical protein DH86_00001098 [Scytalidium sp. 3C]
MFHCSVFPAATMDPQDAGQKGKPGPKPRTSNSLKTQYLVLYNAVSTILWLVLLGRTLVLIPLAGFENVYGGVGEFLKWTQTLALMEVVHAALGIVRAPITTTLMQVASRLLLVWGIVDQFPHLAQSPVYSSMVIAWSVTEVIRYSYFVLNLNGYSLAISTWLRYNTFFVLYPMGISSECWMQIEARICMDIIRDSGNLYPREGRLCVERNDKIKLQPLMIRTLELVYEHIRDVCEKLSKVSGMDEGIGRTINEFVGAMADL